MLCVQASRCSDTHFCAIGDKATPRLTVWTPNDLDRPGESPSAGTDEAGHHDFLGILHCAPVVSQNFSSADIITMYNRAQFRGGTGLVWAGGHGPYHRSVLPRGGGGGRGIRRVCPYGAPAARILGLYRAGFSLLSYPKAWLPVNIISYQSLPLDSCKNCSSSVC